MFSSTSMRWLAIAILCIFYTRTPSCNCPPTSCDTRRPSQSAPPSLPAFPIPASLPVPDFFPGSPLPSLGSAKLVNIRRPTSRSLLPTSLARCQIHYMRTEGLSLSHAVTRCSTHRARAVASGQVVGSLVQLSLPPTRTLPTRLPATVTTPSPRPLTRRQGTVLVDRPRHGMGMVLRDDIVKAVVNSRAVNFGYKLKDSAKPRWRKMQGSARVWYRRLKWFVRISIEEEDLRNGNLLGLLWIGSWVVADRDEETIETEDDTHVAETTDNRRPSPAGERNVNPYAGSSLAPRALVREDTLASFAPSALSPNATPVPPSTRLMIEWHSATQFDQSQSAPATVPRRPSRAVRPGHSVYQPPRMQTGLTEERRIARSEARRQVLEQAKREAQEPVPAPEVELRAEEKPRRKKTRGGIKVQERRAARKARRASGAAGEE